MSEILNTLNIVCLCVQTESCCGIRIPLGRYFGIIS